MSKKRVGFILAVVMTAFFFFWAGARCARFVTSASADEPELTREDRGRFIREWYISAPADPSQIIGGFKAEQWFDYASFDANWVVLYPTGHLARRIDTWIEGVDGEFGDEFYPLDYEWAEYPQWLGWGEILINFTPYYVRDDFGSARSLAIVPPAARPVIVVQFFGETDSQVTVTRVTKSRSYAKTLEADPVRVPAGTTRFQIRVAWGDAQSVSPVYHLLKPEAAGARIWVRYR